MPSLVREIQDGYAAICNHDDAISPYVELHELLDETKPDIGELHALPVRENAVIMEAIRKVRRGKTEIEDCQEPYFRGSGIIVVGGPDRLLAVRYGARAIEPGDDSPDQDPVAEKHGEYQYIAVRKASFAAAIARRKDLRQITDLEDRYDAEQELLENHGLSTPEIPHHLGHAVLMASGGDFLTAGASGMLPSSAVRRDWETTPKGIQLLEHGKIMEWYDWDLDGAAGFHDAVAAQSVLTQLINPEFLDKDIVVPDKGAFGLNANIH